MVLQPYPDEFMAGHMYRLIYRNGFERASQLAVELPIARGDNGLGIFGPMHKRVAESVSYTHLTLPTKRIV